MSEFSIVARKSGRSMSFIGYIGDSEAFVTEMISAMREGLEANGFDVEASISYAAKIDL